MSFGKGTMIRKILLTILTIAIFNACTRDDICAEGTATTPLMIVVFKDVNSPLDNKAVPDLSVITSGDTNTAVVFEATTDSITIPLRTSMDLTEYLFVRDSSDTINFNIDNVAFNYERQDIYVNRACAFKTIYSNLNADLELEEPLQNWIRIVEVVKTTVEDETEVHITIMH